MTPSQYDNIERDEGQNLTNEEETNEVAAGGFKIKTVVKTWKEIRIRMSRFRFLVYFSSLDQILTSQHAVLIEVILNICLL